MNITKGQSYKLIELTGGFVIAAPGQPLPPTPGAHTLVQADARDLVEYLWRYLSAREQGMNLKEAHDAALADAVILPPAGGIMKS